MEAQLHLMLPGFHVQGTQDVVDTSQLGRLSVYRSRPARIVDFREHHDPALVRLDIVGEMVRLVRFDGHHGILLIDGSAQLLLELLVGNGLMAEVQLAYHVNLLIGIVHIVHLVHKPGIAIGIGILYGHGLSALQRHDDIFGVEHVQHGIEAVARHFGHVALCIGNGRHQLLHLRSDIGINHLLVAAQLGSMIAADALMIVGSLVLVEGVRGKVQHTVVEALVL